MGLTPFTSQDSSPPIAREDLTEALDAAHIAWKKRGPYIDADVYGTGHYDHKCAPHKGYFIRSDGTSGSLMTLLKELGATVPQAGAASGQRESGQREPSGSSVMTMLKQSWPHPETAISRRQITEAWMAVGRYLARRGLPFSAIPHTARIRTVKNGIDLLIPLANGNMSAPAVHVTMLDMEGAKRPAEWLDGGNRYTKGPMRSPSGGSAHTIIRPFSDTTSETGAQRQVLYCIGEGLESVASGVLFSGATGIFAVTRGGVSAFLDNPGIRQRLARESARLLVLADRDQSGDGQRSAKTLCEKAAEAGIDATYCEPPDRVVGGPKGADWNDALMEYGGAAQALFNQSSGILGLSSNGPGDAVQFAGKESHGAPSNWHQRELRHSLECQ